MKLKYLYLFLTGAGLVVPMMQFYKYIEKYGMSLQYMLELVFANYISRFFAFDLIIASFVFFVFVVVEGTRRRMKYLWVYILGTLCIGLAFALPLFLYERELKKELY